MMVQHNNARGVESYCDAVAGKMAQYACSFRAETWTEGMCCTDPDLVPDNFLTPGLRFHPELWDEKYLIGIW